MFFKCLFIKIMMLLWKIKSNNLLSALFLKCSLVTNLHLTMKLLLVLMYFSITTCTGLLLFLIIKYLQEKPFGKQFVTDHLSINLSWAIFASVAYLSGAIIIRETCGPFDDRISKLVLFWQQFFNLQVLMCLVSMQVTQFCNVFFSDR